MGASKSSSSLRSHCENTCSFEAELEVGPQARQFISFTVPYCLVLNSNRAKHTETANPRRTDIQVHFSSASTSPTIPYFQSTVAITKVRLHARHENLYPILICLEATNVDTPQSQMKG